MREGSAEVKSAQSSVSDFSTVHPTFFTFKFNQFALFHYLSASKKQMNPNTHKDQKIHV